jgi:hypothetical protein
LKIEKGLRKKIRNGKGEGRGIDTGKSAKNGQNPATRSSFAFAKRIHAETDEATQNEKRIKGEREGGIKKFKERGEERA